MVYLQLRKYCQWLELFLKGFAALNGPFAGLYVWQYRESMSIFNTSQHIKEKIEVNDLTPHPVGENQGTMEKERLELVSKMKKKKIMSDKMSKIFSSQRVGMEALSTAVKDAKCIVH